MSTKRGDASADAYLGLNGEVVIEINNISTLLGEIARRREQFGDWSQRARSAIAQFLGAQHNAMAVVADVNRRNEFLGIVRQYLPLCDSDMLVRFIDMALTPVWAQAIQASQFSYYEDYLRILIDICEPLEVRATRPKFLAYIGDALDRVGPYLDAAKTPGSAFRATDLWLQNHGRIKHELKVELLSYARAHDRVGLLKMLEIVGYGAA